MKNWTFTEKKYPFQLKNWCNCHFDVMSFPGFHLFQKMIFKIWCKAQVRTGRQRKVFFKSCLLHFTSGTLTTEMEFAWDDGCGWMNRQPLFFGLILIVWNPGKELKIGTWTNLDLHHDPPKWTDLSHTIELGKKTRHFPLLPSPYPRVGRTPHHHPHSCGPARGTADRKEKDFQCLVVFDTHKKKRALSPTW